MSENISAHCTLGDSKFTDGNEIRELSRLPLGISSEDPSVIFFPKEKISLVESRLKPFGIDLHTK